MSNEESQSNPAWNLGKKLVIKAQLGDDIRRIATTHDEDITYDELVLMMQRVFRGKLSTKDEVLLKYKDEDGDLVTIFDSSDLTSAIQSSRTLKLTVFLNGSSQVDGTGSNKAAGEQQKALTNVNAVRRELVAIRDRVVHLLDQLEILQEEKPSGGPARPNNLVKDSPTLTSNVETSEPKMASQQGAPVKPIHAKEFDPYQQQQPNDKQQWSTTDGATKPVDKVAESFGVATMDPSVGGGSGRATPKMHMHPQQPPASQLHPGNPQQQMQQHAQPGMTQMGSPYPTPSYQQQPQQQRQPPAVVQPQQQYQQPGQVPASGPGYNVPLQQQNSPYPGAYASSPQPPQQSQQQQQQQPQQPQPGYAQGPQAGYPPQQQPQQQQQQQQAVPPYSNGPMPQSYNPQAPQAGQQQQQPGMQPQLGAFGYPAGPPAAAGLPPAAYQPAGGATTPTNPYSRAGAQPAAFGSRPQYR